MPGHEFSLEPMNVPKVDTPHRRIVTPIPPHRTAELIKKLRTYEPRSMGGTLPVVWDRAEGYQVFDREGNCWIDFTSTIFVANAGHANLEIVRAITKQARHKLLHTYCFPSEPRLRLVQKIVEMSPAPLKKTFLLSTGSEATECALKLGRLYGQRSSPAKNGILCFEGAMHGRTLGAQMMGGDPAQKKWILHQDPEIYHLPFPWRFSCPWKAGEPRDHHCGAPCFEKSLAQLEKKGVNPDSIAAVMIEPYQGWGALFYPIDYIQAVRRWADKHGALVMFDEIQGGLGRTGRFYAFEHYGVTADLICLGKGLSSSLPVSAVVGRPDILDIPEVGSMSSTHSGNPVACAAALANIEYIEKYTLVQKAQDTGQVLNEGLLSLQKRFPDRILSVEGRGLLHALIIVKPGTIEEDAPLCDKIAEKLMQKGLLVVHTGRGSIKIGPPLVIPEEAVREAIGVFEETLDETMTPAKTLQ